MNEPEWVQRWRAKLDYLLAEEAVAVDPAVKFKLRTDIEEARVRLAEWPPPPPPAPPGPSPTRLRHGAPRLFGREDELAWLDRAWTDAAAHVATIVAWGGTGKTALVAEWRNRLLAQGRAPDGLFEWTFYSQGVRDRGAVSADNFLREALTYFGDKAMADSSASGWEKGTRLATLVGARRSLLLLDGLEPLQYADGSAVNPGGLKEDSIEALLKGLAMRHEGLCVVTTRVPIAELERFGAALAPRLDLERLSDAAGSDLLCSLLEPTHGKPVSSTQEEREAISREVGGHALTLQLLGVYIYQALGDIRRWREIDFERANEEQDGHAFRVMDAYVGWLSTAGLRGQRQLAALRLLGFFDRPASPGCIAALLGSPAIPGVTEVLEGLDARGWAVLTASLEQLRLVTRSEHVPVPVRGYDEAVAEQAGDEEEPAGVPEEHRPEDYGPEALVLDAHPLVREFFACELRRRHEAGWREGHRRLYEYLCRSVPYWPEGLEGLQPLYQAIVHGCAAGQTEDACNVYWERILRGSRAYSTSQLGAVSADLGAVACFFERVWDTPSAALDEVDQAWVLGEAAYCLRGLGRLREALRPMRAALDSAVHREDWEEASIVASNLSELELTLGQTREAVEDAAKSVEYADRSGDDYERMASRTTLGDARHQAGDLAGAGLLFEEAEVLQARLDPTAPRLRSLRGYCYCDLLLRPAEREAWRAKPGDSSLVDGHVRLCQEVVDRATHALESARRKMSLLEIAFDHLIFGRAALYAATLLARTPVGTTSAASLSFTTARVHLSAAVDGLRKAVSFDDLPRALIALAQLHHNDDPELARRDLDEAWTLAERGPMPLYQADILLTRARLFHDRGDLAQARELIFRHGYGRRWDELEDAEQSMP